jgi:dipeptidyl aminopeptidase/acylaminoacyl peptidase
MRRPIGGLGTLAAGLVLTLAPAAWGDSFNPRAFHTWLLVSHRESTTAVLDAPAEGVSVAWSPSGQDLAFSVPGDEGTTTYVADQNGSGLHAIGVTQGDFAHPSFSPNGKRVMINPTGDSPTSDIVFVGPDGTFSQAVHVGSHGQTWWLDNSHVLVERDDGAAVAIVDAESGSARKLPRGLAGPVAVAAGHAFVVAWQNNAFGVFAVDARGAVRRALRLPAGLSALDIAASPDGSRIAVAGDVTGGQYRNGEVVGVWAGRFGGKARLVQEVDNRGEPAVSWSQDGRRLLIQHADDGNGPGLTKLIFSVLTWPRAIRTYTIPGKLTFLFDGRGSFASDGASVYYAAQPESLPTFAVFRLDLATGQTHSVSNIAELQPDDLREDAVAPSPTDPSVAVIWRAYIPPISFDPGGGSAGS